jgi:two-component system phosphate regulon response regulator PhoB
LIVDGDHDARENVRGHLERNGFVVWEATSGGEAVRQIAERAPALVMLDVTLPDVSGLQVCRRLRADEATRGVGYRFDPGKVGAGG